MAPWLGGIWLAVSFHPFMLMTVSSAPDRTSDFPGARAEPGREFLSVGENAEDGRFQHAASLPRREGRDLPRRAGSSQSALRWRLISRDRRRCARSRPSVRSPATARPPSLAAGRRWHSARSGVTTGRLSFCPRASSKRSIPCVARSTPHARWSFRFCAVSGAPVRQEVRNSFTIAAVANRP